MGSERPHKIMIVAAEPSGDVLGARLLEALRASGPAVTAIGVGGPRLAAQGLASLFPYDELAVMGLAEVVPKIPAIFRRIAETEALARNERPDAVITIDSPDFSFRVARRLASAGMPLIHYVAPTVWAWRPDRARKIARYYDRLLALLPFEPPWFERVGLPCDFVGHPVIESGADRGDGMGFRARHDIAGDTPILVVLPGSRRGEIRRLISPFGEAVARLATERPVLRVVIPTLGHLMPELRAATASWAGTPILVEGDREKYDAFAAAQGAIAASGTVALELALAGLPHLVAYRMNPLTYAAVKAVVKVRHANLVNLLLDREVVPEFLQWHCRPERLAEGAARLMFDPGARAAQRAAFAEAIRALGQGGDPPSRRAASALRAAVSRGPLRREG
ncbi:MAG: lipid-A-disaccharide synthase [Alphaproteobacteria bacterium]|nr:lipid-A-disaccharide synthase [Alphaproteobacteria bacterium]